MDFKQIIFENGNVCFYFYLILFNFSVVANAHNVECRKVAYDLVVQYWLLINSLLIEKRV